MSGFMRHMSLVTNNNDHIHKSFPPNFPIIHNRLIHRGVAEKGEKKLFKSLKSVKLKKKVKLCHCKPKLVIFPLGVLHIQTDRQTHTHTHTRTWPLSDQPGSEGRVGEKRDLGRKFSAH